LGETKARREASRRSQRTTDTVSQPSNSGSRPKGQPTL